MHTRMVQQSKENGRDDKCRRDAVLLDIVTELDRVEAGHHHCWDTEIERVVKELFQTFKDMK